MWRLALLPVALVLLAGARGWADDDTAKRKPLPKKAALSVEVKFADGSIVNMAMLQEAIEIETKYGRLKVPTSEIRGIDLGVHLPAGTEQKIAAALGKLNSPTFKDRDAAVNDLVEIGVHAYPTLIAAGKTPEPEVAQRIQMALKRIRAKVAPELLRLNANDRLITTDFPISGRIITPTFKARTPYFGELDLKLSELRSISWVGGNIDSEIVVDAAKHALANQWLDTNITLDGTTGLTVTAAGEVDLVNDGSGDFVSGPAGTRNIGGRRVGNKLPGALMGRIGETGTPFVIGERYQALTVPAGKLYLHIQPAPFNNGQAPSGSYKAVVRAGFFLDGK